MIGTCEVCNRENVPVSHIDTVFGIEAFACYLCQCEDDPDPYGELSVSFKSNYGDWRTMIGNRVRVITGDGSHLSGTVEGNLKKIDAAGVTVWRTNVMPEAQGNVFIPMHRIQEIVDLGRVP